MGGELGVEGGGVERGVGVGEGGGTGEVGGLEVELGEGKAGSSQEEEQEQHHLGTRRKRSVQHSS